MLITAASLDIYKEIEDAIATLPDNIKDQITGACKNLAGIMCTVGNIKQQEVNVPKDILRISFEKEMVRIHTSIFIFDVIDPSILNRPLYIRPV